MGCITSAPTKAARSRRGVADQVASGRLLLSSSTIDLFISSEQPAGDPGGKGVPEGKTEVVGDFSASTNSFGSNQDRFVVWPDIIPGILLVGVFDGHGKGEGGAVAEKVADRLPTLFREALLASGGCVQKVDNGDGGCGAGTAVQGADAGEGDARPVPPQVHTGELSGEAGHWLPPAVSAGAAGRPGREGPQLSDAAIAGALRAAFLGAHAELARDFECTVVPQVEEMRRKMEEESGYTMPPLLPSGAGTTATVAVLHGRRLHVAWVGDSRAVVVGTGLGPSGEGGVDVTRDHDAQNAKERQRAEERGGAFVGRHVAVDGVEGMVQTLRSIGDVPLHKDEIVTAEPEVEVLDVLPAHAALVVASDGVWGHFTAASLAKRLMDSLGAREYPKHCETAVGAQQLAAACHDVAAEAKEKGRAARHRDDAAMVVVTFSHFWRQRYFQ